MASQERPTMTVTMRKLRTLRAEMDEIKKSFILAMTGRAHLVEKAVRQSLKLYGLTGCPAIVFLGLKLAYHARNPEMASTIFDAMFEGWEDFGPIFYDWFLGEDDISRDAMEAYQWCLKVASYKSYQNVNMVDVPYRGFTFAAHAAAKARAGVLLMLLRNGADPYKASLLLEPSLRSFADWDAVVRLILRALPYPSANILRLEPGLVLVPRLKHLCKVVIRSILACSHSLPERIYDLDIPLELKEYLDLLRDP